MRHLISRTIIAILLLTNLTTQATTPKIIIGEAKEINYVTHLYTLAGICGEDAEYCSSYAGTLPREAIDTLIHYSSYLQFGRTVNGALAGPFFFGIASEDIASREAMEAVVERIIAESASQPDDVKQACRAIGKVYVENYKHYLDSVYPGVKQQLAGRIDTLNALLGENTIIADWQRVLGMKWEYGDYHFLLFRAGENSPSFNDLNKNTNTLYYNLETDFAMAMFSHEFGIFMMRDIITPIFMEMRAKMDEEGRSPYIPWNAFESLACWYGCKIAGGESADVKYFENADVHTLMEIYSSLEKEGITDIPTLYRSAIARYISKLEE
ncbi:MAG: hypothetical protein ACI4BC_03085 [Muribaculaceae bacterium]